MEDNERMDALEARMEKLIEHQERTNESLHKLIDQTSGIIGIYQQAEGTIKMAVRLQKVLAWCAKWPLIMTGLYALMEYFNKKGG